MTPPVVTPQLCHVPALTEANTRPDGTGTTVTVASAKTPSQVARIRAVPGRERREPGHVLEMSATAASLVLQVQTVASRRARRVHVGVATTAVCPPTTIESDG